MKRAFLIFCFAIFCVFGAVAARSVLQVDEDERTLLLAVRKPEATVASFSSIEVSFETGPALREFDYTIKCVLFDDALVDGCDADAVGDVVTGQTTKAKSTIAGEVTGLEAETDYQCYVIVETEKRSKCMYVVTPTIEAVPVIRMAGVNTAGYSWYLPDISAVPPPWVLVTSAAPYGDAGLASLAGDVWAVSIRVQDTEGGLWYTDDIEAFADGIDDFPIGFTQLPLDEIDSISNTLRGVDVGFQIGFGDRMVAWDSTNIWVADDWRSNTWLRSFSSQVNFRYASVTGDLVAAGYNGCTNSDSILLYPNAFDADGSIDPADSIVLDLADLQPTECPSCPIEVTSVSLYGDYLAFTIFFVGEGSWSKIYYVDLSTLTAPYDDVTFVEVPTPTIWAEYTEGAAETLRVSIALGQMVVSRSGTQTNNMVLTTDFINVTADDWSLGPLGQIDYHQLSTPNDIPVPPVLVGGT